MKLLIGLLGAVIASVVMSVVINWLVLPRDASAQERTLKLFGSVKGKSVPDGYVELAFNFYDKDTEVLAYRSISTAVVQDGSYTASLPAAGLTEGKEYYVLVTLPNRVPGALQQENRDAIGVVLLQSETPGIQQTGHVNISGTLIAGAIKTNAFQMPTGAAAGRVLTSDATGNGTWQTLPPPSGTAGGDLSGTYPNPLVDGLQGWAVASTAPATGQVLKWNGSAWSPGTDLQDAFWQASGSDIFYNAGSVGIGTIPSTHRLAVQSPNMNTLWLIGPGAYGSTAKLNFGDSDYVYLQEDLDDRLIIYASQRTAIMGGPVGIGTTNPVYSLHVETGYGDRALFGYHTATSGFNYGVYGQSDSPGGAGVYGLATATGGYTYGGRFVSKSTGGRGVFGYATATSGETYGVYGRSDSTYGYGVVGDSPWIAVLGYASSNQNNNIGVWGKTASTTGNGVVGEADASSGYNRGVWGTSASVDGIGVYGVRYSGFGSGYGVYFGNGLAGTGTKSFQMDHPLMPETHYLNHFCTEGPEPYNTYRGNVVTDAYGYATVQLPDYFESINRDPTYHLTVIDDSEDFVLAKVVREIQSNQFVIRTSKPNAKVSWEVKAIRNDLWVQKYGFKTEQEKPEVHKGKYLSPELYGMPKEYGIYYRPEVEPDRMAPRAMERSREIKTPEAPRKPKAPPKGGTGSPKAR